MRPAKRYGACPNCYIRFRPSGLRYKFVITKAGFTHSHAGCHRTRPLGVEMHGADSTASRRGCCCVICRPLLNQGVRDYFRWRDVPTWMITATITHETFTDVG